MDDENSIQQLLARRKLTRSIAENLRTRLSDFLSTLTPLLRPQLILGQHVESEPKLVVRDADKNLKEFQSLFETVAAHPLYGLRRDFRTPLELVSTGVELTPLEYSHEISTGTSRKTVLVTSPCRWSLGFTGYPSGRVTFQTHGLKRLKELLAQKNRTSDELQATVLHFLAAHFVLTKQPGLMRVFEALSYPFRSVLLPEFGPLPIACLDGPAKTELPSDEVILQNTEISGVDVFEEVVGIES